MWFIPYLESKGDAQLFTKVRQGAHICTVAVYLTPNHAFLLRKGARACSTSLLPPEHTHQFSSWLYNTQLGQSNFTEKKTCGDTNWNPVATNSLAPQEQSTLRTLPPAAPPPFCAPLSLAAPSALPSLPRAPFPRAGASAAQQPIRARVAGKLLPRRLTWWRAAAITALCEGCGRWCISRL